MVQLVDTLVSEANLEKSICRFKSDQAHIFNRSRFMATFFSFIKKNKHIPLTNESFTEVDALIFAQLSYQQFEHFVPTLEDNNKHGVLFTSLMNRIEHTKTLTGTFWRSGSNQKFLKLLNKTDRYKNLKLNYCKSIFSHEDQVQFVAFTFFINDVKFVCFRGTDLSVIGWKEDFNMILYKKVPAQRYALEYLNEVSKKFRGRFFVGGHSKGGNLAVYSSVFTEKRVQNRIEQIYAFDSPGFNEDIYNMKEYKRVKPLISKYIPRDSIIGLLLNHDNDYQVVKSRGLLFIQHDALNWNVVGDQLKKGKMKSSVSLAIGSSLLEWLNTLDVPSRDFIINQTFMSLKDADILTLNDVLKRSVKKTKFLYDAYQGLEEKQKDMIILQLNRLAHIFKKNMLYITFHKKRYLNKERVIFVNEPMMNKFDLLYRDNEDSNFCYLDF